MIHLEPKDATVPEVHRLLLGGVAPRPIALVSTISTDGINNLSPFSFFNAFGANPPMVAFSPARRGRDGTTKDTLNNLKEIGECVVHSVTYDIVEQINLASTEFPPEVDEFVKSGLTPIDSDLVRPRRVKESPFHMECLVRQIIPLGERKSSGNLVLCEVIKFHVDERIIQDGFIRPDLINLVGRNSADYYTRACGEAIFELPKPGPAFGIGFDQLPDSLLKSNILTANNLGQLAGVSSIPPESDIDSFLAEFRNPPADVLGYHQLASEIISETRNGRASFEQFEIVAKEALKNRDIDFAWKILLAGLKLTAKTSKLR